MAVRRLQPIGLMEVAILPISILGLGTATERSSFCWDTRGVPRS